MWFFKSTFLGGERYKQGGSKILPHRWQITPSDWAMLTICQKQSYTHHQLLSLDTTLWVCNNHMSQAIITVHILPILANSSWGSQPQMRLNQWDQELRACKDQPLPVQVESIIKQSLPSVLASQNMEKYTHKHIPVCAKQYGDLFPMNWGSLSGEYDYINVSGQSKQWTHLLTHLISLLGTYPSK